MDRILDLWSARSQRERVLAVAGLAAVAVAVMLLLLGGGTDEPIPATIVPNVAADANPDGTSGSTKLPPGTIRATPRLPEVPAATTPGGVAPVSSSGGGGGSGGGEDDDAVHASKLNTEMNRSWQDVPVPEVPADTPTSQDVAAAGLVLEQTAQRYNECIKVTPDHYDCLEVVPKSAEIDRVFDSTVKGLALSSIAGGRTVRIVFRGSDFCRMLDDDPSCTAWSTG